MSDYPYYTEPTHDTGVVTDASGNAAKDTTISAAEGRLKLDVKDKIFLLEPNKHPLVSLLTSVGKTFDGKAWKGSGIMKKATGNPEFGWLEDFYGGKYCKVSGTYTTGAVTITVTGAGTSSAYIFTPGDIVMNARTGERMLVATVASATTITVAATGRSLGSTAAVAGADGDELFIVGNANEENSGARNANMTRVSKETNYTQIFKTTIAVTGTEKEADLYGPKDLIYQRAKKGTEHALDIEKAFWFGEKGSDTDGTQGHARRYTGGILEYILAGNSYVQDQSGVLTGPDMNLFLKEGFTYGDTEKVLMCGGNVLAAINEIASGKIQMRPNEKSYGMQIAEWITPFGKINIIHNPLFTGTFAGYGFLLDLNCFAYRYMNNRDTRLLTNVQGADVDGEVDQFITEAGLERKQAPLCALIKGVE